MANKSLNTRQKLMFRTPAPRVVPIPKPPAKQKGVGVKTPRKTPK